MADWLKLYNMSPNWLWCTNLCTSLIGSEQSSFGWSAPVSSIVPSNRIYQSIQHSNLLMIFKHLIQLFHTNEQRLHTFTLLHESKTYRTFDTNKLNLCSQLTLWLVFIFFLSFFGFGFNMSYTKSTASIEIKRFFFSLSRWHRPMHIFIH